MQIDCKRRSKNRIMNVALFKQLAEALQPIYPLISKLDIWIFLLDYENYSDTPLEGYSVSRWLQNQRLPKNLNNYLKGKNIWDIEHYIYMKQGNDSYTTYKKTLQKLYTEYIADPNCNLSINELLSDLIRKALFDDYRYFPPTPPFLFNGNSVTISKSYIERKEESETILTSMKSNHKLLIYGSGGSGKTQLAKKYVRDNRDNYQEVCFVQYLGSLDRTIESIIFKDSGENSEKSTGSKSDKKNWNYLKYKSERSLLCIDNMDSEACVMKEELSRLQELSLSILITSRTACQTEGFTHLNVKNMDKNQATALFNSQFPDGLPDSDVLPALLHKLKYHPLLVDLAARTLKKSRMSIQSFSKHLERKGFTDIENVPKIKLTYDNKDTSPSGHILAMLDVYSETGDIMLLKKLSCLCPVPIPLYMVRRYIPEKELTSKKLQDFTDRGWIDLDIDENGKDIIQMHPLISDTIFYARSIVFDDYELFIERIHANVNSKTATGNEIPIFQEILLTIFKRLDNTIRDQNNKNQKQISLTRTRWWQFCLDCIQYYLEYFNTEYAEYILNSILQNGSHLKYEQTQPLVKYILDYLKDWINGKSSKESLFANFDKIGDMLLEINAHQNAGDFSSFETLLIFLHFFLQSIIMENHIHLRKLNMIQAIVDSNDILHNSNPDSDTDEKIDSMNQTAQYMKHLSVQLCFFETLTYSKQLTTSDNFQQIWYRINADYYYNVGCSQCCLYNFPEGITSLQNSYEIYRLSEDEHMQLITLAQILFFQLYYYLYLARSEDVLLSLIPYREDFHILYEKLISALTAAEYYTCFLARSLESIYDASVNKYSQNNFSLLEELSNPDLKTYQLFSHNPHALLLKELVEKITFELKAMQADMISEHFKDI